MKKQILGLALAGLAVLTLAGCAPAAPAEEGGRYEVYSVPLIGGGNVHCVSSGFTSSTVDSPSCDWANAGENVPAGDSGSLVHYLVPLPEGGEVSCVGSKYTSSANTPNCDWESVSSR